MATSPGRGGGSNVLNAAKNGFPYFGGNIVANFSLPSFNHNFSNNEVINEELKKELIEKMNLLEMTLNNEGE